MNVKVFINIMYLLKLCSNFGLHGVNTKESHIIKFFTNSTNSTNSSYSITENFTSFINTNKKAIDHKELEVRGLTTSNLKIIYNY